MAQRRITYYRHLEVGDSARVAEITLARVTTNVTELRVALPAIPASLCGPIPAPVVNPLAATSFKVLKGKQQATMMKPLDTNDGTPMSSL